MEINTVKWQNGKLRLIDQSALPFKMRHIYCRNPIEVVRAIKDMKVRGAPAIGVAAAYAVYLGSANSRAKNFQTLERDVKKAIRILSNSRPTARNLFWAVEKMKEVLEKNKNRPVQGIKKGF